MINIIILKMNLIILLHLLYYKLFHKISEGAYAKEICNYYFLKIRCLLSLFGEEFLLSLFKISFLSYDYSNMTKAFPKIP